MSCLRNGHMSRTSSQRMFLSVNLAVHSDDLTQRFHPSSEREREKPVGGESNANHLPWRRPEHVSIRERLPITMTLCMHSRNPWRCNCIERFDIRRKTARKRPRNRREFSTASRAEAPTRKGPKSRTGRHSKQHCLSRASQRFASHASLVVLNLSAYSTELLPPHLGAGVDAYVNIVDIRGRRHCTPLLMQP